MKSLTLKVLPVVAAAALLSPLAITGMATAAPVTAACGKVPPDLDPSPPVIVTGDLIQMRTGSSTSCAIRGLAYSQHALDYYCYTISNDGRTWTYARNLTTGNGGWIRDDSLPDGGSAYWCGF